MMRKKIRKIHIDKLTDRRMYKLTIDKSGKLRKIEIKFLPKNDKYWGIYKLTNSIFPKRGKYWQIDKLTEWQLTNWQTDNWQIKF